MIKSKSWLSLLRVYCKLVCCGTQESCSYVIELLFAMGTTSKRRGLAGKVVREVHLMAAGQTFQREKRVLSEEVRTSPGGCWANSDQFGITKC